MGSQRRGRPAFAPVIACVLLLSCGGDPAPEAPAPTSPATEQAATPTEAALVVPTPVDTGEAIDIEKRVEHRFEISQPDYLAVAGGSVWVKTDNGLVHRIDPGTNKVVAEVRAHLAGGDNLCQGLGASEDSVWSCSGQDALVQIDTASNEVVTTVAVTKASSQGNLPVSDGHVWILSSDGMTVHGIDTASGEIDVDIPLDARCSEVAAGEGTLWVTCQTEATVLRIDLVEQAVTARIGGLPSVRRVAVADSVWVGYADGLARIDPATAEVVGAVTVTVGDSGAVFADAADVWVRTEGLFLQRIDAQSMAVTEIVTAPETSGGSVLVTDGSVWASAYNDGVLYRLRP